MPSSSVREAGLDLPTQNTSSYLLVGRGAVVLGISDVVGAEDPLAGIALEGEEVWERGDATCRER